MDLYRAHVLVCGGTGCSSSGSGDLIKRFEEQLQEKGLDKEVKVIRTGCFGLCEAGPVVIVYPEGTFYSRVKVEDVDEIVSDHVKKASAGGFVTGVGGLVTMPVSLPANVLGFYVLATRMVAAMAEVRGYDVTAPGARAAISLSLVGADAEDILQKTGLSVAAGMTGSGRLAKMAMDRMPKAAGMMINKAVGFRLLTTVGGRALGKLIRFVPIAGGVVGAGLDGVLMKRLADHARREFVQTSPGGTPVAG